jgi:hypothetical protein
MKLVKTSALTPALSPKERESAITSPDNFPILVSVTDPVLSAGDAGQLSFSPGSKRGEQFPLSWGRGPG